MPLKTKEQLESEKAALENRLTWLTQQENQCPKTVLDTRVKLNNISAQLSSYTPYDFTPNPPGAA